MNVEWKCLLILIGVITTIPQYTNGQGNHITAYLVGNSHDDVGWQMTIDGYYEWHIRTMFDTTVAMLSINPQRKFVYCEMAFFTKWWADNRTTAASKTNFTTLLHNKQVEFVIGGWVMNDEGNPSYSSIIDQLTEGHQFLKEKFGVVPEYMWQIDPSGLTSAMPTLASYAGMKGHLIDRIDFQLKNKLKLNKQMEFMWQGSPSLTTQTRIFTHVLWDNYCVPYFSFNWDKNDAVNSTNLKTYADTMVAHIKLRQQAYLTTHVLVPWVCDFAFENAQPMFLNMDRIVEYIQQHSSDYNVTIKYALLSEYFEAVQATNVKFPDYLFDDFLPYYVEPNGWRTGFYTSRPEFKGLVREKESTLRSVDSIFALSSINFRSENISFDTLVPLRQAVAEVQHHDAIVGTMRENVLASYIEDLTNGAEIALKTSARAIALLLGVNSETEPMVAGTKPLLTLQKGMTGVINTFNSLGWSRRDFVKVPINVATVIVVDAFGTHIPSQVLLAREHNAQGKYNLFFEAITPALGYSTYFVVIGSVITSVDTKPSLGDTILMNDFYHLTVSNTTGRISKIQNVMSNTEINIDQNFLMYQSYEGTAIHKSDPYFMSVTGPAEVLSKSPPISQFNEGPYVQEAYQEFFSNESAVSFAKQIVRLYHFPSSDLSGNYIEVYHEIGVLPPNRELITQYSTSIESGDVWFTDENGYEEMKRVRNPKADQPIPANYYPGVYTTRINDGKAQLMVLSERTHSVSSQTSGSLQIMLHRRITTCPCEISEPMNDTTITTPVLRLIVDTPKNSPLLLHRHSYLLNFPLAFHSGVSALTPSEWAKAHPRNSYAALSVSLPPNVHLLSFKALNRSIDLYLLRFTHIFATGEDATYSAPATVDVGKLFSSFKIKSFQQTSLTANQAFKEVPLIVQLSPKEIKTFLIQFV